MSWIACMAHIPHKHIDYIKDYIDKRFDQYIIALETSAKVGEHIHFMLYVKEPKDYSNFAQNVFKQKFNLKGRATTDNARQYGRVKDIKSIQRMMAYTVKDANVITKVEDQKALEKAFEISFRKEDRLSQYNNKILAYVNEKKTLQADGYFTDRNDFVKTIIETYWDIFGKLPGRAFQLNQIYKYEHNTLWYMLKSGTYTDDTSQSYKLEFKD